MTEGSDKTRVSFEEFKLYYDSTEKVTDRRLDTNRWNYSICTAIVIAIATITNWSLSNPTLMWVGFAADVLLASMAILFCLLWIGQIRDFKNLNNAKFSVLNAMAPRVDFDTDNPGAVRSFCPFDKEWTKLTDLQAVQEVGASNIIALKSSNMEYFIPKAFGALFCAILAVLVVLVVSHWPPSSLAQEVQKPVANVSQGSPR
jgi:di/tricarboxylate transporter